MCDLLPKQQAFTRGRYDDFHQIDDARITSYAARYYLAPPEAQCQTSFPVNATARIQRSGDSWPVGQWRTDVESDLKGVNRFSSRVRCDDALYNPDTNRLNQIPLGHARDTSFDQLFQRLTNPPCTLRTTGINRWHPLIRNPQETFETPFDHFIPSRLLDKEKCKTHASFRTE